VEAGGAGDGDVKLRGWGSKFPPRSSVCMLEKQSLVVV